MHRRQVPPVQHWAYLRFVVIACGLPGLLMWHFGTLPGHATATLPALLIGMASFAWLDGWLQGPEGRKARLRDAARFTVVVVVALVVGWPFSVIVAVLFVFQGVRLHLGSTT